MIIIENDHQLFANVFCYVANERHYIACKKRYTNLTYFEYLAWTAFQSWG